MSLPAPGDLKHTIPQKRVLNNINNISPKRRKMKGITQITPAVQDCLSLKNKLKPGQPLSFGQVQVAPNTPTESLDKEIARTKTKIEDLEDEITATIRQQHKYQKRISELSQAQTSHERALERETDVYNREMHHHEEMLKLDLKDLEIKLADDANELRFNLEAEIASAKTYKNEECWKEVDELTAKEKHLQGVIERARKEGEQKIACVEKEMAAELEAYMQDAQTSFEAMSREFEQKESEIKELRSEIKRSEKQVQDHVSESERLKKDIQNYEAQMTDFPRLKHQYLSDLAALDKELAGIRESNSHVRKRWESARNEEKLAQDKLMALKNHNRLLEDSIMDLQGNTRVYCKYPESWPYMFSKRMDSFDVGTVSNELSFAARCVLKGTSIFVAFVGEECGFVPDVVVSMYEAIKDEARCHYQQIYFEDTSVLDGLCSSDPIECDPVRFPSQQMILDGATEFSDILQTTRDSRLPVMHRISAGAKSDIRVLDLSKAPDQSALISAKTSLGLFLKHSSNAKRIFVGEVNDKQLLDRLQSIMKHSMNRIA